MKKRLVTIAVCLVAGIAMLMMAACEDVLTTPEPDGPYQALPGVPGGGSSIGEGQTGPGWGVPDSGYTGRRFDINNLPPPATWNALGHQHAFPDPFHFANGNKVVTVADWENRRKEILKILQYYEYGIMPSIAPEDIDISWVDSGVANCTITVTHKASGRTFTFTQNTTLPAHLATAENEGKASLPLYFGGAGNWEGGTGTFNQGTFGTEADGSGGVHTLFGINTSDGSAPSANSDYAWGMSIILTVMEGIDKNGDGEIGSGERGFRGFYDPKKVGITGYSRNGKAAMCIAAFAEGREGSRIGHASIGSAGSGGPAIERFLSPAGYRVNGQYADPLPLDGPGLMEFGGLVGKPWYMKKIENGDPIPGADSLAYASTPEGSADAWRYRAVRGWSPYFEEYHQTPTNYSTAVTTPFIGWQSPAETWSGIQSLSEGRNETPGWFSVRFREFADLHYGLDIDHVRGMEGRSKYGILCTIPFDQHYLGVLIAGPGRGIIFQDGFVVPRNNPESQFANWLIADEVYKLYGEAEGEPEKYIWNNAFMMTWGTHGGNSGNEGADRGYHAMKIFNGEATTGSALGDPNLMKLRTPLFQVDDPISRFDFYRMNWGRPGHPTIEERVKARVEPILADYTAGEATRPVPSAFAPATHPNYTPTGPKFKAMDWRGLLDQPELLD
jgi:hypothetical protein